MGNDLPVIAPRMRRGVGYVSVTCPQNTSIKTAMSVCTCRLIGRARYVCDHTGSDLVVCPVWATRTVARLEAAEAQLAAWESQDAHEGMDCHLRTKRLEAVETSLKWFVHLHHGVSKGGEEFEPPSDQEWTDCLDEAKELLSTYPGKDGQ